MEDESKPEVDDWLAQPHTKLSLEKLQKKIVPDVHTALLRACHQSSDPAVRYWYARYVSAVALEEFLTKGDLQA